METLIHTKKAPLILTEPLVNTNRFSSSDQRAYFDEWAGLSVSFLSGSLGATKLWTTTMPQVTLEESTLRYGAMAIGALRKSQMHDLSPVGSSGNNRHFLNAIVFYCEALRLQAQANHDREGLRTVLLSSLLFICFESLRGDMPSALKHMIHGFNLLNELAACSDTAPDLVSIAPAPPAMVQEILDCYKPLELQSRSFMGSYKKFFFHAGQRLPGQGGPGQAPSGQNAPDAASPTSSGQSPPSQPGTPWQASAAPNSATGLPSPQSQDSPTSQASQGRQSSHPRSPEVPLGASRGVSPGGPPVPGGPPGGMPAGPPGGPPGGRPRPPGIAPFTKHSPYFRPKITSITKLEDLPQVFQTFDEANGYWALLQRQMVQYIPVLTVLTAQLGLSRIKSEAELSAKLDSVKQHPKISHFIAESRYWLQRWIEAFNPYFRATVRNAERDYQSYLVACNIRVEYLILYIYTAVPRFSGLITAKGLTPQYREINTLAETLLRARPSCGFAMDSGWTWPLFVTAFSCRDPAIKDVAMRLLGQFPVRNALRDSLLFRAIAQKNLEIERHIMMEGDENEQWLRLRRREMVFEDFGASVIFRFADKDPETGRWELVEETSPLKLDPNGMLNWQRQPISDNQSILSGVC